MTSATVSRCALPEAVQAQAARFEAEINLVRTQPRAYADLLERSMSSLDERGVFVRAGFRIRTQEGRAAVVEALAALRQVQPLKPLTLHACLSLAAQGHAQFLSRNDAVGHAGAGGSMPSQRASQAAGLQVACAETVSAGPGSARDHVMALLVDDGVPDRGHRKALLDPNARSLGAGSAAHSMGSVSVQLLCHQQMPN